jgi:hypothetical protein
LWFSGRMGALLVALAGRKEEKQRSRSSYTLFVWYHKWAVTIKFIYFWG